MVIFKPGGESSSKAKLAETLILDSPTSKTIRKKKKEFKPLVCVILLLETDTDQVDKIKALADILVYNL